MNPVHAYLEDQLRRLNLLGVESVTVFEPESKGETMRATHDRRTMTMVLVLGTILGMAVWAPRTGAADSRRAVKWQFSIPITFTSVASYDAEQTSIDVHD